MEFRETLLAAQRNQQQKSSESGYYKARFDPPKKEQKTKDRLTANIQKFLAQKEEEEKQKELDAQKRKEELLAMRDPKALRKIQKTLKVIKSANKSVLEDAVDHNNTAVTLAGAEQPDQDDYGYESQEAAALYAKMMQKYSKIPDEPKFPVGTNTVKRDLNGTRERVKNALQHEDDPVPHKRRRRTANGERELSPPTKYEPEKQKEETKPDKPKIRKPMPPPMDFNQLLKLAEQKKSEPLEVIQKKVIQEAETERPMTKQQRKAYEEEMKRKQRRQERLDAGKAGTLKAPKPERIVEREQKTEPTGFGRIPKLNDKTSSGSKNIDSTKLNRDRNDRDRIEKLQKEKDRAKFERERVDREREKVDRERERVERERERVDRERDRAGREKERAEREKERADRERLERLKAERERIERDIERLNKDRDKLEKAKSKLESRTDKVSSKSLDKAVDRSKLDPRNNVTSAAKKNIDLKSQNTYRIDKNSNEKKLTMPHKNNSGRLMNNHSSQEKLVQKSRDQVVQKNDIRDRAPLAKKPMDASPKEKFQNGKRLVDGKTNTVKRPDDRKLPPNSAKPQPSSSKITNSFDFDKHVSSLGKNGHPAMKNGIKNPNGTRQFPPGDLKKKQLDDRRKPKRRALDSDSEFDSELDDFIDDGDEDVDVSSHIKSIFGYDKSKYRDFDDEDDPSMVSNFAQQQREEYLSKKIGIMEDLEDMRLEALEKKKSKKRRISDD